MDIAEREASLRAEVERMLTILLIFKAREFNETTLNALDFEPVGVSTADLLEWARDNGYIAQVGCNARGQPIYQSGLLRGRHNRGFVPLEKAAATAVGSALAVLRRNAMHVRAIRWLIKHSFILAVPSPLRLLPAGAPLKNSDSVRKFLETASNLSCLTPVYKDEDGTVIFFVLAGRCAEIARAAADPYFIPQGEMLEKATVADILYQALYGVTYSEADHTGLVERMCSAADYGEALRWIGSRLEFSPDEMADMPAFKKVPPKFILEEWMQVGIIRESGEKYSVNQVLVRQVLEAKANPRRIPAMHFAACEAGDSAEVLEAREEEELETEVPEKAPLAVVAAVSSLPEQPAPVASCPEKPETKPELDEPPSAVQEETMKKPDRMNWLERARMLWDNLPGSSVEEKRMSILNPPTKASGLSTDGSCVQFLRGLKLRNTVRFVGKRGETEVYWIVNPHDIPEGAEKATPDMRAKPADEKAAAVTLQENIAADEHAVVLRQMKAEMDALKQRVAELELQAGIKPEHLEKLVAILVDVHPDFHDYLLRLAKVEIRKALHTPKE